MSLNVYTPNKEEPLNLDLSLFNQNKENTLGLRLSVIFYGLTALGSAIALLFRTQVLFIYQYTVLFEAMTAILLFLALKCGLKLLRLKGFLGRTTTVAARLIRATENDGETSITVEFKPNKDTEPMVFTEKFSVACVDDLRQTGLNALPLSYKGKVPTEGSMWLELKFINGILATSELRTIKNA